MIDKSRREMFTQDSLLAQTCLMDMEVKRVPKDSRIYKAFSDWREYLVAELKAYE
jgi:hypothetical protein